MEAFKAVDGAISKPVHQTDAQGDWRSFRSSDKGKKTGDKRSYESRTVPHFPRLGGAAASGDVSHYDVGFGNSEKDVTPAASSDPLVSGEDENRRAKRPRNSAAKPQSSPSSSEWEKLMGPKDGKVYYFHRASGKVSEYEKEGFIPSACWSGPKEGFAFKTGEHGTGYYAEKAANPRRPDDSDEDKRQEEKEAAPAVANGNNPLDKVAELLTQRTKKSRAAEAAASASAPRATPVPAASTSRASDWVKSVDSLSRREYYYNKRTKETSWTVPAALLMGGDWKPVIDPATKRKYYYNVKTRETSWTLPKH